MFELLIFIIALALLPLALRVLIELVGVAASVIGGILVYGTPLIIGLLILYVVLEAIAGTIP